MDCGHGLAHRLLGLTEPTPVWYIVANASSDTGSEMYDRIANATEAQSAVNELYLVLCAFEAGSRRDSWRNPSASDQLYMSMAVGLGYQAPDVDLKMLDPENVDDVIAEALGAEQHAAMSEVRVFAEKVVRAQTNDNKAMTDMLAERGARPLPRGADQTSRVCGNFV
jgi:ParB family chromosome partitioning protein